MFNIINKQLYHPHYFHTPLISPDTFTFLSIPILSPSRANLFLDPPFKIYRITIFQGMVTYRTRIDPKFVFRVNGMWGMLHVLHEAYISHQES